MEFQGSKLFMSLLGSRKHRLIMSKVTTLAVYWGPRKDSAEKCARCILDTYSLLTSASFILSTWYDKSSQKKAAMGSNCTSGLSFEQLVALLEQNVDRGEIDGNPIHELGFSLAQWNKMPCADASALRFTCGSFAPNLNNAVVLNLPESMTEINSESYSLFSEILGGLVKVWKPEWGALFDVSSSKLKTATIGMPFFDKMLWTNGEVPLPFDVAPSSVDLADSKLYVDDQLLHRVQ